MILGINAYHGDVSAALFSEGRLIAAVEEERFSRIKHVSGFPRCAIQSCLDTAGISPRDIQHIGVSRNPSAHLPRKILFALTRGPAGSIVSNRIRNAREVQGLRARIPKELGLNNTQARTELHWIEHHASHLASTFFVSPFHTAAVCAIDGFGDFVSTSWGIGSENRLRISKRIYFPHSIGLLYLAITQYLGFRNYGDEYKVMGLAPYGSPEFVPQLSKLIHCESGGAFRLDLSYFCHHKLDIANTWADGPPNTGLTFTPKLEQLLGPARRADEPIEAKHEAVAASLQVVFETVAFHVLNAVHRDTKQKRLCLAGGCAMNSVMNGKIRSHTPFEDVYIQPAAGDNGTALGAALHVQHEILRAPRQFEMVHSYWGPQFSAAEITAALTERAADLTRTACKLSSFEDTTSLVRWTARRIAEGDVVGWFQGRMEWGARALGNRSIVADPRRHDMREIINTKIKFRERFRPFAPSIMEEALNEYFVDAVPDPFMIQVYPVRENKRQTIPAVTHVDGSGRLQTVSQTTNLLYWQLLNAFNELTGVPVLLNTSFNENEPIVLTPAQALDCFLRTDMDVLVLGTSVAVKAGTRVLSEPGSSRDSALQWT